MSWTLDPETYICPDHGIDLTSEVRAEALADGTDVTWIRGTEAADVAWVDTATREYSPAGPFLVVITCPGKVGDKGEEPKPHERSFAGVVR